MLEKNINELMENKLCILYGAKEWNDPIPANILYQIFSHLQIMDYFTFQQNFVELQRQGYLQCSEITEQQVFEVTQNGKYILSSFENRIAASHRKRILEFIETNKKELVDSQAITSHISKNPDGASVVTLSGFFDREKTIELQMLVPDNATANLICSRWETDFSTIYLGIIDLLTKQDEP